MASISSHVPCSESWEVKEKMKTSDPSSESQDAEMQNAERAKKCSRKNDPAPRAVGRKQIKTRHTHLDRTCRGSHAWRAVRTSGKSPDHRYNRSVRSQPQPMLTLCPDIKLTALSPSHILRLTPPFVYPFFSFLLFF